MSTFKPRLNLRRAWYRVLRKDGFGVPCEDFTLQTEDGVQIEGTALGQGSVAIVVLHALMGYRTKPPWRRLSEALSAKYTVYAMDLRGHGSSGGGCSGGSLEALDVKAAVAFARSRGHETVLTLGGSLGAAGVLFEAATFASSDGIILISPPARWVVDSVHEPAADGGALRGRLLWFFSSPVAQAAAAIAFGAVLTDAWVGHERPIEAASRVRVPALVVHGQNDHLFPMAAVRDMASAIGSGATIWEIEDFGHCEDGFSDEFFEALMFRITRLEQAVEGDQEGVS